MFCWTEIKLSKLDVAPQWNDLICFVSLSQSSINFYSQISISWDWRLCLKIPRGWFRNIQDHTPAGLRLASLHHPNPRGFILIIFQLESGVFVSRFQGDGSEIVKIILQLVWDWYLCIQITKRWFRNGRDNWKLRAVASICTEDMISCTTH